MHPEDLLRVARGVEEWEWSKVEGGWDPARKPKSLAFLGREEEEKEEAEEEEEEDNEVEDEKGVQHYNL